MFILILILFSVSIFGQESSNVKIQIPEGMVFVPAGNFIMGSIYGDPDERPKHIAYTIDFYIDQYEITNGQFSKFDAKYEFPKGRENSPAVVNWFQANNYAESVGKRLPTEKEWEKAARGTDGRTFPWGETYDETYVVWDRIEPIGSAIAKPESPYGCYDMAGSVWEWTADWYQPYPENEIPMEQYGEKYKVMRGGSNFNNHSFVRTTQRYYVLPDKISHYFVGFRCVKDVE